MGNKRVMVIMPSASNCAAAMSISVRSIRVSFRTSTPVNGLPFEFRHNIRNRFKAGFRG
jgi:hypothetical protein